MTKTIEDYIDVAAMNLRGDDFQAFGKGSVDEITALSKEIGILK